MKIIFFGTSNVALPVLEALNNSHEVVAVVTTPDGKSGKKQLTLESPVSVLAGELQLPTFKPENPKTDAEFFSKIDELAAEMFVVVSYGKILPKNVINLPKYKTLNIHFSKLPEFKGASPIQFALLEGRSEAWTSIFILDEEVDHGPILAQKAMPVDPSDNFITLSQSLAHMSAKLLIEIIPNYTSGKLQPTEQNHVKSTFTKIISREDGKVDWNQNSTQVYNKFRAFYPWPGLWTTWQPARHALQGEAGGEQIVKILDCQLITPSNSPLSKGEGSNSFPLDSRGVGGVIPGTVLEDGIVVCGENSGLQIKTLQLSGKRETELKDFLNGNQSFIGSILK